MMTQYMATRSPSLIIIANPNPLESHFGRTLIRQAFRLVRTSPGTVKIA